MLGQKRFSGFSLSKAAIFFIAIVLVFSHYNTQYFSNPEKVIRYDIKSYYAYFPALYIENDLKQNFLKDPDYSHKDFFWKIKDQNGNFIIQYSCGMSILYFPFVLIAHHVAPLLGFEPNGFTEPYSYAIILSNLFFVILGLWFFRKLLLHYFTELTSSLVIIAVLFGTNLFHYSVEEPAMPHAYMFSLGSIFLYFVHRWHLNQSLLNTILVGFLSGLISLTRPNNILILFILIFWNIGSLKDLQDRVVFFLRKWHLVLLMIFMFFLAWSPQFIYWKIVTGNFLYYSYGPTGGDFYFLSPHFLDQLFSYRKGAIMYSPILLFAFFSIIWVVIKNRKFGIPILIYSVGSYWFLASWWSWWNGGGFGIRMYVDTYPILFFAFAFLVASLEKMKNIFKYLSFSLILLLSVYGWFRNYQYANGVIHFDTNTKEMYWRSLFRTKPIPDFWKIADANRPDYFLARCGIYVTRTEEVDPNTDFGCLVTELRAINKDDKRKEKYKQEAIDSGNSFFRICKQKALKACED